MSWFDVAISILRLITLSLAVGVLARLVISAVHARTGNGLQKTRSALIWLMTGIVIDPLIRIAGWIYILLYNSPSIHAYYKFMRIPLLLAFIPLIVGIHKFRNLIYRHS